MKMSLSSQLPQNTRGSSNDGTDSEKKGGILLQGYLRKLKRMKKKYFILFDESESTPSRLEYFDSEKKWKSGQGPKRSISIKSCFNINRRTDCKHKLVVALYTKEDCFSLAFDCEKELDLWLLTLLQIQLSDHITEGEELKPIYEHVWQVNVRNKELGNKKNITGTHRLCLTSRLLRLVKMPMADVGEGLEFPLMNIRRCGHSNCLFFMELGRGSVTGAGELWMESEDTAVAQSMHGSIIDAMRNCAKEDMPPRQRTRSSSMNNEQSRPANVPQTSYGWNPATGGSRERADSVPSKHRSRTTSEGMISTTSTNSCSVSAGPSTPGSTSGFHHMGTYEPSSRPVSASYLAHHHPPSSPPASCTTGSGSFLWDSPSSSLSNDDIEAQLAALQATAAESVVSGGSSAISGQRSSRYSHNATPENSLPKNCMILEHAGEEYLRSDNLHDSYQSQVCDYLEMTPQRTPCSSTTGMTAAPNRSKTGRFCTSTNVLPGLHPEDAYVDMSSPVAASWSPPPAAGTSDDCYMSMLPSTSGTTAGTPSGGPGSVGTRSGTHTRSSSFGEDFSSGLADGYVPMAPLSIASSCASREEDGAGYMEMRFRRSVPRDVQQHTLRGRLSPASSSSLASSVTSGTPSVACGTPPVSGRFNEYHLDKVVAMLTTPEDEDELPSLRCRQSRAYSVGSRPDLRRRFVKVEAATTSAAAIAVATAAQYSADASRVRAFSVGSRMVMCGAPASKVLLESCLVNIDGSDGCQERRPLATDSQQVESQSDAVQRKKSLSVPTLGTSPVSVSWSQTTATFLRNLLGHGRENDLMEMEFSREAPKVTGNSYVSAESLAICSAGGLEQMDVSDGAYLASYGSSESVSRASNSSNNSGSGRPRSRSSSTACSAAPLNHRSVAAAGVSTSNAPTVTKPKLDSVRSRERKSRGELERLESVPQGRYQDYIECSDGRRNSGYKVAADNLARCGSADGCRSLHNHNNKTGPGRQEEDSADEYVELAKPPSSGSSSRKSSMRGSVPKVSITDSEHAPAAGVNNDYMLMDYGKNSALPAPSAVQRKLVCDQASADQYLIMNFASNSSKSALSQPASVSDSESYLPMDFTPTPKLSRNSSRQSSQADLSLADLAFSPPRSGPTLRSGAQSVRSGTQSARHSRTEETLQDHYMEMTFSHSESYQSLRSEVKSPRSRHSMGVLRKSEHDLLSESINSTGVQTSPQKSGAHKATAFLSNFLGRKSSGASSSGRPPMTMEGSGTLPRSSRSMPPSPFSSLKRSKSSKKQRHSTAQQPMMSPELDTANQTCFLTQQQKRNSNSRSGPPVSGLPPPPASSPPPRSLYSPITPPSPTVDFSRLQLSPPPTSPSNYKTGTNSSSSKPISISPQNPAKSSMHANKSPASCEPYRASSNDLEEYVLPSVGNLTRFSTSPARSLVVPTLSPLPEVNTATNTPKNSSAAVITQQNDYVNMNFSHRSAAVKNNQAKGQQQHPTLAPTTAVVASVADKENSPAADATVTKKDVMLPARNWSSVASVAAAGTTPVTPAALVVAPTKQRANSLEIIVGALEKVKPKRHSSGDKPAKRSGPTLIYRSNSYQPSGSRVVVAGSAKSASIFPQLRDIPAGKMVTSCAFKSDAGLHSLSPNNSQQQQSQQKQNQNLNTNHTCSLVSLGEDFPNNAELPAAHWACETGGDSAANSGGGNSLSPAHVSNSCSPLVLPPTSVLNKKDIQYCQLDLAANFTADVEHVSKSPRNVATASVPGFDDILQSHVALTTYAQIDFQKSEGLKNA